MQRVGGLTYYDDYWVSSLEDTRNCADLTLAQIAAGEDANLYSYMVSDPDNLTPDIGGLATKKAICNPGRIDKWGRNTNTIEFFPANPAIDTAKVSIVSFLHCFS